METDKEIKPIISWFQSNIEESDIEFEWDCLIDELDQLINEINIEGYWYCEVENFGWRGSSGYAYLKFETGVNMIRRVLPQTECSFNIFREGNMLKIQNYHHDSATGNEWYTLTPISYEQYENQEL